MCASADGFADWTSALPVIGLSSSLIILLRLRASLVVFLFRSICWRLLRTRPFDRCDGIRDSGTIAFAVCERAATSLEPDDGSLTLAQIDVANERTARSLSLLIELVQCETQTFAVI